MKGIKYKGYLAIKDAEGFNVYREQRTKTQLGRTVSLQLICHVRNLNMVTFMTEVLPSASVLN